MFSFNNLLESKKRPLIMGILNITPDSFSDGGEAFSVDAVAEKVKRLCDEGADIIDVGACSTAPGNSIVSEEEEIGRLQQFLPAIINCSTVPVSVDTFRPAVAKMCLEYGVDIINDESGVFKKDMAELVEASGCGWIVMHTGGKTSDDNCKYPDGVVADVCRFFEEIKSEVCKLSISEEQVCFDCGIGFGKLRQDDLTLMSGCTALCEKYPLLIGVSRKRIIGEITGESNPKERVFGSVAAAALLAQKGVSVLRVHDVKETLDAIKVSEAIKRGVL